MGCTLAAVQAQAPCDSGLAPSCQVGHPEARQPEARWALGLPRLATEAPLWTLSRAYDASEESYLADSKPQERPQQAAGLPALVEPARWYSLVPQGRPTSASDHCARSPRVARQPSLPRRCRGAGQAKRIGTATCCLGCWAPRHRDLALPALCLQRREPLQRFHHRSAAQHRPHCLVLAVAWPSKRKELAQIRAGWLMLLGVAQLLADSPPGFQPRSPTPTRNTLTRRSSLRPLLLGRATLLLQPPYWTPWAAAQVQAPGLVQLLVLSKESQAAAGQRPSWRNPWGLLGRLPKRMPPRRWRQAEHQHPLAARHTSRRHDCTARPPCHDTYQAKIPPHSVSLGCAACRCPG